MRSNKCPQKLALNYRLQEVRQLKVKEELLCQAGTGLVTEVHYGDNNGYILLKACYM